MRQFKTGEWQESLETMQRISGKKKYVQRFRLEYYLALASKVTSKHILQHLLGFFSSIRYIAVNQLGKRVKLEDGPDIVFPLQDSASFLKTVLPVILQLQKEGRQPLLLCQANHYHRLKAKLPPAVADRLMKLEQVSIGGNALLRILSSTFKAIADMLWMLGQPVRNKLASAVAFGRYALTSHSYGAYWKNYFHTGAPKVLVAANDYQLWESLLFTAAEGSASESIVLQHGKLSDLYYPLFAKRFYAWGKADRDIMLNEYKAREEEIVVTGSSYFDQAYQVLQPMATPEKPRKWVAFFSQNFHKSYVSSKQQYDDALAWFYSLSEPGYGLDLVIKPHPFDPVSYYSNRPAAVSITDCNIFDTLAQTSIAVFLDSTAAFEAAMAGVPCVQCLQDVSIFQDLSVSGLAVRVRSRAELHACVSRLQQEPAYRAQILQASHSALTYYFANLGHATEVIAGHIAAGNLITQDQSYRP